MRYKYPRTVHLPWSPGVTADDLHLETLTYFQGKEVVVVTEKMDGENTTMYGDYIHARSIDGRYHSSRDWVKQLHAQIAADIPRGWRLCGENLYAVHSIAYKDLKSYFYLFAIFDENNLCLNWHDTLEWAALLNLPTPPCLYRGLWNEEIIKQIRVNKKRCEGYVVRTAAAFEFSHFQTSCAKWVRQGHVQSDSHWMHQKIVKNELGEI
ncbi:MAG: RNA ligase family protein [Lentisphaeraceae bacterium]|nr:RNA ligase family protein [Lentisphaeraceae bacterium]